MSDLFPDAWIPLGAQIKECERELRHRERAYPRLIRIGTLAETTADGRLIILRATLRTLRLIASLTPRNHQE